MEKKINPVLKNSSFTVTQIGGRIKFYKVSPNINKIELFNMLGNKIASLKVKGASEILLPNRTGSVVFARGVTTGNRNETTFIQKIILIAN